MIKTILVFGDSITWGAKDLEKGGWVNRLKLFFESNNKGIDVYNLGVSGDNSRDLLERFENESNKRIFEDTLIIILIGTNDSSKHQEINVPIREFEENLIKLLDISRSLKAKLLFLGINKVDESRTSPVYYDSTLFYKNKDLREYEKIVKDISKIKKIPFLKLFNLLKDEDFDDGVHPNAMGHEKIFQRINKFLIERELVK